jgi:hypothetical protein
VSGLADTCTCQIPEIRFGVPPTKLRVNRADRPCISSKAVPRGVDNYHRSVLLERPHRRRQAAEAQARAQHLLALGKRGEHAWCEIEDLIVMRNASAYDKVATLLLDLREIAAEAAKRESFTSRLAELRCCHARKGVLGSRPRACDLFVGRGAGCLACEQSEKNNAQEQAPAGAMA